MWYLAFTALSLVFLLLAWRYYRLTSLLKQLSRSITDHRLFLLDRPFTQSRAHVADRLSRQIQHLLETEARFSRFAADTVPQLQNAVELLREAVIIIGAGNLVVVANESARRLLGGGKSIRQRRLEQILKGVDFLDCVRNLRAGQGLETREVEINRGRESVWFEVSGSPIHPLDKSEQPMTILVLHDISRLKQLEKLRKDFVANVSHELKTPLTVIKGYSETLAEDMDSLPRESQERFLQKILSNVERLNLLIEDLLTLSRLESGPDKLQLSDQHLPTLVADVIENFESRLRPESQLLVLEAAPEVGPAKIDPVRIAQTFENLIDNAIRYAANFSCIRVLLHYDPESKRIVCSVADDGAGIPERDLPHIFERFYRVDKGRSRERGGTGLGLSIVKHIVLLHGGDIWPESKPGDGTTITFTLPASPVSQAAG